MFLFKLFGVLDILAGVALVLSVVDVIGIRLPLMLGAYLIIKGFMFNWDVLSVIDFFVGAYVFLSFVVSWWPITLIICVYLVIKGIWSWF
ncbi:MAG: hypothetical protein V1725_06005 [archaeon]